jgi:hypothetical protein
MLVAALSTGGVVAIVVGAVSVIAGAFYALVHVQGERINDAREDFGNRVETLDSHMGERMDDLVTRVEQGIDALGDKIDTLTARLDRVEGDLSARS